MDLLGHPTNSFGVSSDSGVLRLDEGWLSLPTLYHTHLVVWSLGGRSAKAPRLRESWDKSGPSSRQPRVLLLDAFCRQIHICIPSRTRCWFLAYISLFPRFRNQNSSMIATASHIVSQGPAMCPTPNWALYLVHQPRRTSALHGQFCRVWFLHPHPRSQEWSAFQKQNSKGIPYF